MPGNQSEKATALIGFDYCRGEREKLSDTGWSKRIRNRLQMLPVNKTALLRSVTLNSFAQILSYRTTLSEGGRRVEVTSNEVRLTDET